jgi:hypothetical protein
MREFLTIVRWPFRFVRNAISTGHLWIEKWLAFVEAMVITGLALFCLWRGLQYGLETEWKFHGLLPLLHNNWRGAIFLAGALFYRTILIALSRMRKIYDAWGESLMAPVGDPEIVDIPRPRPPGARQ